MCKNVDHFDLLGVLKWRMKDKVEASGIKTPQTLDKESGAIEIKRAHSDDRKKILFHATCFSLLCNNRVAAVETCAKGVNLEKGA
mmetsp:Transcript_32318/g.61858  ORF Transcript_32318/g.61858 Transcript_32318/m.61858 type:complete len:85 (+) Transcript_32318:1392-1646(+)